MSDTNATIIDLTDDAPATGAQAVASTAPVSTDDPIVVDEDTDDKLPKRAVVNEDGSITLPLLTPLTLTWRKAGVDQPETVSSVTLRRLNGKDLRVIMSSSGEAHMLKLTEASVRAQYTSVKWAAIYDRMDGADAMDVFLVAQRFLTSGPKTPGS